MIKNLHLAFVSIMMMFTSSAFAQTEFDFDTNGSSMFGLPGESSNDSNDGDFTEAASATVGDFTVTVSPANEGVKNANRIWNSAPKLRMYSGTLTVSSTGASINKIEFTLASQASKAKWGASNTASTGDINAQPTLVTWTGAANEVVFTIAANTQISKITINGEGGGEVTPPVDPEVKEVSVAEALAIIDALEDGATTKEQYLVKGYVVSVTEISAQFGNATFTMADEKGGSPVLTAFRVKGFDGADITDSNFLAEGDEVVVKGKLQKYVKGEVVTPEIAQDGGNSYVVSVNGKTADDTPVQVTKAADIASFIALADGTVAELTLNNAVVTYKNVNGQNIELFIRDASGAMDLYNTGIEAEAGQVLSGTIIGTRGVNSGFTYVLKKTSATDAATVTVGEKQDVAPVEIASLDEATYDAYGCDLVKITGVKIVGGKAQAGGDELALYDRFKTGLLSGLDEEKDYDVTGLIYDGGKTYGTELVVTALTLTGGGEIVEQPATPVASIESMLALESPSENLELTLTNAKVLFNDNNYIYMRENGKALCFYKIDGLKDVAKNNAVVNGKIDVDYEVYKLLPEVKSNKNTKLDALTIEESEEEAEPVQTTLAEVAEGKNVCDLVILTATLVKEVAYKEDGVTVSTTTYYLQDGDVKLVAVNNGKGLNKIEEEGAVVTVVGIVNTNNNAYQVKLTKSVTETTAISDMTIERKADNGIFNLQGQRIEKLQRGVNIVGGKKVIVK